MFVEVLFFDNFQLDKEVLQEGCIVIFWYFWSFDGYFQIGFFYKGVVEGEVDLVFGFLEVLCFLIQMDFFVWVILSEIFLKKVD